MPIHFDRMKQEANKTNLALKNHRKHSLPTKRALQNQRAAVKVMRTFYGNQGVSSKVLENQTKAARALRKALEERKGV